MLLKKSVYFVIFLNSPPHLVGSSNNILLRQKRIFSLERVHEFHVIIFRLRINCSLFSIVACFLFYKIYSSVLISKKVSYLSTYDYDRARFRPFWRKMTKNHLKMKFGSSVCFLFGYVKIPSSLSFLKKSQNSLLVSVFLNLNMSSVELYVLGFVDMVCSHSIFPNFYQGW